MQSCHEPEKKHLPPRRIRPIALCVVWQSDQILVAEYHDPNGQIFYRPLGGSIEYGEYSQDTIKREMLEEIKAEISHLEYLGTIENIFTYLGQIGHEIVQIYQADFIDSNLYKQTEIIGSDTPDDKPIKAVWKSLTDFKENDALRLVPDGLLEMLAK